LINSSNKIKKVVEEEAPEAAEEGAVVVKDRKLSADSEEEVQESTR